MNRTGDAALKLGFRALAQGDLDGLETVWETIHAALFAYLFSLLGQQDEADDALADVMARLAGQGRCLRRVRQPRAYLFRMARNVAVSRLRRDRTRRDADIRPPDGSPPVSPDALAIREAVLALPPEQREVVALHIWGDLTFAEIGHATRVSPNTAAGRYRYAIDKLAKALGDEEDGSQDAGRKTAVCTDRSDEG